MSMTEVLARLKRVRANGRGWMALCPAHPDRAHSLSVAPGRRPGYVLLHCFRGCDRGSILAALGMSDEASPDGGAPASPAPEPDVGTPEWYALAHRLAVEQDRQARARRDGWWGQARTEGAELHRWCLDKADALAAASTRIGYPIGAVWDMVMHEREWRDRARLLGDALDRGQ